MNNLFKFLLVTLLLFTSCINNNDVVSNHINGFGKTYSNEFFTNEFMEFSKTINCSSEIYQADWTGDAVVIEFHMPLHDEFKTRTSTFTKTTYIQKLDGYAVDSPRNTKKEYYTGLCEYLNTTIKAHNFMKPSRNHSIFITNAFVLLNIDGVYYAQTDYFLVNYFGTEQFINFIEPK
jgi:hypothetical protein